MSQTLEIQPVHEPFVDALLSGDNSAQLDPKQQELILKEADRLPFQWLGLAWQKTRSQSMHLLVRIAQEGVQLLLEECNNRLAKHKSGFHEYLQDKFTRFITYLQTNHSKHFNSSSRMPRNMWEIIKKQTDTVLPSEEPCTLQMADTELLDLIRARYLATTQPGCPSFAMADYWNTLVAQLKQLPPGEDMTLRVIYLLVSYNFNSSHFVSYLLHRFAYGAPEENALLHWTEHIHQVNLIPLVAGLHFDKKAPSCKALIQEAITAEINAIGFITGIPSRSAASAAETPFLHTNLTVTQLAGLIRLLVETGILTCDNHTQLTRDIAACFTTRNRNAFSAESMRQKYYNQDMASIGMLKTHLGNMMEKLRGYQV